MNKKELLVLYGKRYKTMTKELLERAGLDALIPKKDTLIGIKPNLLGQVLAEEGGTTHPEVVAGLIEYLQEHGFTKLILLEGSWVGDRTGEAVHFCGFDRLCEQYGVPFFDMQKEPGVETDCGGMMLNLCRKALEVEYLINVPVLKGHCQTRITCALKNMKGLIPNSEKRRFHRMGLHNPIGHLSAGLHQDFILTDSICGDLTFEDGGNPVEQNRLIAALDPVLMDAYGCFLLGIPLESVPYIATAAKLGIGSCDLAHAVIRTWREKEDMEKVSYPEQSGPDLMAVPEAEGYRHVMKLAEKAEEVDSCSACYGYLIPALKMLEEDGLLDALQEKICIGQGYRGRCKNLGVGNCTREFVHTVGGCPPTETQMYEFLKEYLEAGMAVSEKQTEYEEH
ncbi:MAG: DUF362 domain-containing protein [Lachnospiraceae bacterium]|nr:DUF362 domain-containing protein [Lachnospiraceae bacterium]MDD3795520.1 DUF362 domain-containing protein [Lachnospiraceae bacterium]